MNCETIDSSTMPTLMSGSLNWRSSSMMSAMPMASCRGHAHMECLPMNHTTTMTVAGTHAVSVTASTVPQSHSWQARLCSRGVIRPKSAPSAAVSAWMAAKQNITVCMKRKNNGSPVCLKGKMQSTGKDRSEYAAPGACD